jgi:hypothetical protein
LGSIVSYVPAMTIAGIRTSSTNRSVHQSDESFGWSL